MQFTHGVPNVVITNCGGLPSYWKANYKSASSLPAFCDAGENLVVGGCRVDDSTHPARLWESRAIDWSRLMNDVKGVSNVLRRFLPNMVKRGTGSVVNVTHVLDPPAGADVAAYQASRAAISALTRKLSSELPAPMTAVELDPGELTGLMSESEVGNYRHKSSVRIRAYPRNGLLVLNCT